MPAAKKHSSVRARANKATTAATLTMAPRPKPPTLPRRGKAWHAQTRSWWADIWASPMSAEWDPSDLHGLLVMAAVYDDIWTAATAKDRKDAAAEYRLQRKDFGLTPYDRRRLEWTIEQADAAKTKGARRRSSSDAPKQRQASSDPRELLRLAE